MKTPSNVKTPPFRIALAGDSTLADYPLANRHRGWGQLFPLFVDGGRVLVVNFAANGRSTKTFQSEGKWAKLLATRPDYVFIQFGHNDSHAKGRPESTDAKTNYAAYLRAFVQTARAAHALPLLVTPMHRGQWDENGLHLTQELLPYTDAMRRVANETTVPLLDLFTRSETAFESIGSENLKTLFAVPETDRTHFNEKGAKLLAGLVAQEAARLVPELRPVLRPPLSP